MGDNVEVARGDVLDPESPRSALIGVHTAYYLIHAMATPRDFAKEECEGARNFARAARDAGVQRVIYLGGLGTDEGLSPHLASRHEVGRLLREPGVHTIELRAAVILGSGSLSFELVRALVERLPVRLRGVLDLMVGGAGMRRRRRDPKTLCQGDVVDFWRVETIEPNRLLRLRPEMKLPGRAWLQFEVSGDDMHSVIRQTAVFEPHGLAGVLYWYALYPVHSLIFGGMLRGIARAAERSAGA